MSQMLDARTTEKTDGKTQQKKAEKTMEIITKASSS